MILSWRTPGLAPNMTDRGSVQMVQATAIHQSNGVCCHDLIVLQVNLHLHFELL